MDNHTTELMFSSKDTDLETPGGIFVPLNTRFNFTLDAAASHENHLLPRYCTPDGYFIKNFSTPHRSSAFDGLSLPWGGHNVFVNPPYGKGLETWLRKAVHEYHQGVLSVWLLPARTETSWFQRWVAPYATVYFLMGRINFLRGGVRLAGAPFPSIVCVYDWRVAVPHGAVRGRTWDWRSDPEFHYDV